MPERKLFVMFGIRFLLGAAAREGVCQTLTTLRELNVPADGTYAYSGLIMRNGDLFGTASQGGTVTIQCQNGCGTVFKLSPSMIYRQWGAVVLHSFAGGPDDGYQPTAGLTQGPNGVLYGATSRGGNDTTCDCGIVFELTPPSGLGGSWTETVIHSFSGPDGANPQGVLAMDFQG